MIYIVLAIILIFLLFISFFLLPVYISLIIILFFLLLILGLLLLPFRISLNFLKKGSSIRGSFRISWLGIRFIRLKIPLEERKEEKEKAKFEWRNAPEMLSLFTESAPYFMNILNAVMKSSSIEIFSGKVFMGLDSPVDTALISGYLWMFASLVNLIPNVYLSISPDFQKSRFDGSIIFTLKIRLFRIVIAFIRAFLKKPVRQLFNTMRK